MFGRPSSACDSGSRKSVTGGGTSPPPVSCTRNSQRKPDRRGHWRSRNRRSCAAARIAGGATSLAQVFPYFSDPNCSSPIELSFVETGDCDPATRFAIDQRGTEPSVRPLVAAYPGRIYEISTADT